MSYLIGIFAEKWLCQETREIYGSCRPKVGLSELVPNPIQGTKDNGGHVT